MLAQRLGLPFTDMLLLNRAFTHRSFLNEHSEALEDNERLEFLGDAVLDFIVASWLYNHFPEMPEGDLTRMRAALVHTEKLAEFSREMQLGNALKLGRGEMQNDGRNRSPLLCDVFEALVGALYLDSGIDTVTDFVFPLLEATADQIFTSQSFEDPKSRLQEWAQASGYSAPQYVTRNEKGPDHSKVFEVVVKIKGKVFGVGVGPSKQSAAKIAAKNAIQKLNIIN
ncbi:MAG: ribonuclease III [Anaerolineaceae bacterium]|nr:ribonuclease III [Anaerolineaceae bacterium]